MDAIKIMHYLDTIIQYYPASVYETKPIGVCSLREMFDKIRTPKPDILKIFKQIESFNGILVLDFDNLSEELAKELKVFLFNEYKFIIASFLSASKRGVKCFVRIPKVKTIEDFKALFFGLAVNMQWIVGFDQSSQNCMLPNYLTYDEEILIREDAEEWTVRGYKENAIISSQTEHVLDIEATEEDRELIKNILRTAINRITDTGHYILRSTAIAGFGYVGAGYFSTEEMLTILDHLIDNNDYLSLKARAYKNACSDMIAIGITKPIYLK